MHRLILGWFSLVNQPSALHLLSLNYIFYFIPKISLTLTSTVNHQRNPSSTLKLIPCAHSHTSKCSGNTIQN